MVSPVPVHPDIDSKNADKGSIYNKENLSYGIIQKGILPINDTSNHPSAAVTIADLKFAGSAFRNI
jgi:hypothetical protein